MASVEVEITGDVRDVAALDKITVTKTNQFASALVDTLQKDVKQAILDTDAYASGTLYRSIATQVLTQFQNEIDISVGSPLDYSEFANDGRQPGVAPPKDVIMQWMIDKGVESPYGLESGSFLIARSIGQKGTEGKHFFEEGLAKTEQKITSIAERIFG